MLRINAKVHLYFIDMTRTKLGCSVTKYGVCEKTKYLGKLGVWIFDYVN